MRSIVFVLLFVASLVHAETFVGPTSATNRFIVATNEVVIIKNMTQESGSENTTVTLNGKTRLFPFKSGTASFINTPSAIAGECELSFTNKVMVFMDRITNSSIQSILIDADETTTITVAENQTLRIFPAIGISPEFKFRHGVTESSTQFFSPTGLNHPMEFDGPLEVDIHNNRHTPGIISYAINDPVVALEPHGVVQGPTGTFRIHIERSADMETWVTSGTIDLRDEEQQFYRFRIGK